MNRPQPTQEQLEEIHIAMVWAKRVLELNFQESLNHASKVQWKAFVKAKEILDHK